MVINAVLLKKPNQQSTATLVLAFIICALIPIGAQTAQPRKGELTPERICHLIAREALTNGLPPSFFARLLWKESLFEAHAISPAGAQGIAQFMPGTAKSQNLKDPFDPEQAIPASAIYLSKLRVLFGNLGLAAAAYNAGEERVETWLARGGTLPIETENYVLEITGEPADAFFNRRHQIRVQKLDPKLKFRAACVKLATSQTLTDPMAAQLKTPWAVQIAGNYNRAIVQRIWSKIKSRNRSIVENLPMSISQSRTTLGRKAIFTARLGASTRNEANAICAGLRANGHSCVVLKNQ